MSDTAKTKLDNPIANIRNIGIMAHIDAGKTTTTERILFYTKKIHKIGEIDDGAATMDFMAQEQERGITIQSAATTVSWRNLQINIIDTPGHVDFTAEVERSLRVLDGAILVLSSVDGVQPQTQTVWREADEFCVPRICFVNKMDRIGANFQNAIQSITDKFSIPTVALQLPIGEGEDFRGIIDLVKMRSLFWDEGDQGVTINEKEIEATLLPAATKAREKLIDDIASNDDTLGERYLNGEVITNDDITAALRRATLLRKVVPCLLGSSRHNIGVQPLLDAVVNFLPSPLDVKNTALHPKKHEKHNKDTQTESDTVTLESDPTKNLAALIFKVQFNKDAGLLCYARVYSGTINTGTAVYLTNKHKRERVNRILRMNADKSETLNCVKAGDIAVLIGLKEASTGDTIGSEGFPVLLEKPIFPEPVISLSIEAESISEKEKLLQTLAILSREDPTFTFHEDDETGELLISGMGELHLEVIATRLRDDFGVKCRTGSPRVSYREGITKEAKATCEYSKVIAGKENKIALTLSATPLERGSGCVYESTIHKASIGEDIFEAIESAVKANFTSGINLGYPCVDMKIALVDLDYSETLSTPFAAAACASLAFDKVCNEAAPIQLEPVMKVEIESPLSFIGSATTVAISRGAQILGQEQKGNTQLLHATAPMQNMFGFATALRSATQGQASFSLEFSHFEPKI